MHLVDYIWERKLTIPKAALEIGCARNTLWRIAKRYSRPSPELAERIIEWSHCHISLGELMAVRPDRPRRAKVAA